MTSKRGSVLLHVLVTGALIALIAATLLRMALLRYQITAHATATTKERRADEAALNMVITSWNSVHTACANNVTNYTCSGGQNAPPFTPPGTCNCTCNPTGAIATTFPTIIAGGGVPPCTLVIGAGTDLP